MIPIVLAVIGAVVGLALDALVVRLAVPFEDEEEEAEVEIEGDVSAPSPLAHLPLGEGERNEGEDVVAGREGLSEGLEAASVVPAPSEGEGDRTPSTLNEDARFGAGRVRPAVPALSGEAGTLVMERNYESKWLRRPAIVLATAGLFAAAGLRYSGPAELALVTAYLCALIVCASTDALSYRVPNVITYPAIILALVAGLLMPDANALSVIAGGAIAGGVLLLPSLLTGGVGMGMGDVKLATFVGLALGLQFMVPAMLLMALLGGLAAVLFLVTGARKRGEPIPYAPFISAGAIAAMLMVGTAFESL